MTRFLSSSGPDRVLRLEDGRRLAYREYGARDGWPVLALHGTPGSKLMFSIAEAAALELGLRLIAPDRWGYGKTDPHPRPSLEAWARDAAELVDALELSQLSLVGISGGSPYAAATAAHLGDRIVRMALAVPVGPLAGNPVEHRLAPFHRFIFLGVGRRPGVTRFFFRGYRRLVAWKPRQAVMLVAVTQCPSDRALLRTPAVQEFLSTMLRDGLEPGVQGPAVDLELFASPWDFPLDRISSATRIWIGNDDQLVPLSAARHLASAIPNAELTELEGCGHFWIAQDYRQVLDWLAESRP